MDDRELLAVKRAQQSRYDVLLLLAENSEDFIGNNSFREDDDDWEKPSSINQQSISSKRSFFNTKGSRYSKSANSLSSSSSYTNSSYAGRRTHSPASSCRYSGSQNRREYYNRDVSVEISPRDSPIKSSRSIISLSSSSSLSSSISSFALNVEEDTALRKRVANEIFGYDYDPNKRHRRRKRRERPSHDDGLNPMNIESSEERQHRQPARQQPSRGSIAPSRPGAFHLGGSSVFEHAKGQLTPMRENKERPTMSTMYSHSEDEECEDDCMEGSKRAVQQGNDETLTTTDYLATVACVPVKSTKQYAQSVSRRVSSSMFSFTSRSVCNTTRSTDHTEESSFYSLPNHYHPHSKRRFFSISMCVWSVLSLALVAAIVVLISILYGQGNGMGDSEGTNSTQVSQIEGDNVYSLRDIRERCFERQQMIGDMPPGNENATVIDPELRARMQNVESVLNLTVTQESPRQECSPQSLALAAMAVMSERVEISSERYALLVLYFVTNGDEWKISWNDQVMALDRNHCLWYGVTCAEEQVTSISLDANDVSNSIPNELIYLSHLEILNIKSNKLSGTIPTEIGKLTSLKSLNLSANKLTGRIPSEIGELKTLKAFAANENQLEGTLPTEIAHVYSLEALQVLDNQLTGQAIPSGIGSLTKLTELALGSNRYEQSTIPSGLWELTNLRILNAIESQLIGTLPIFELLNMTSLTHMGFEDNDLKGTISSYIGELTKLEDFRISANEITGSIPSHLGACTRLTSLDLSRNRLEGQIPTELNNLVSLDVLDLQRNARLTGSLAGLCKVAGNDFTTSFFVDGKGTYVDCRCCS